MNRRIIYCAGIQSECCMILLSFVIFKGGYASGSKKYLQEPRARAFPYQFAGIRNAKSNWDEKNTFSHLSRVLSAALPKDARLHFSLQITYCRFQECSEHDCLCERGKQRHNPPINAPWVSLKRKREHGEENMRELINELFPQKHALLPSMKENVIGFWQALDGWCWPLSFQFKRRDSESL